MAKNKKYKSNKSPTWKENWLLASFKLYRQPLCPSLIITHIYTHWSNKVTFVMWFLLRTHHCRVTEITLMNCNWKLINLGNKCMWQMLSLQTVTAGFSVAFTTSKYMFHPRTLAPLLEGSVLYGILNDPKIQIDFRAAILKALDVFWKTIFQREL